MKDKDMIETIWDYLILFLLLGWMMEGCNTQESEFKVLDTLPTDSISYKTERRNALKTCYMNVNQADSIVTNIKYK